MPLIHRLNRFLEIGHTILISCLVYTLTITHYGHVEQVVKFTCLNVLILFGSGITWIEQVTSPPSSLSLMLTSFTSGFFFISHLQNHDSTLSRHHLCYLVFHSFLGLPRLDSRSIQRTYFRSVCRRLCVASDRRSGWKRLRGCHYCHLPVLLFTGPA